MNSRDSSKAVSRSGHCSGDDVAEAVVTGPDPAPYLETIDEYVDAGFDQVYLHQAGPRQQEFIECAARESIPEVG